MPASASISVTPTVGSGRRRQVDRTALSDRLLRDAAVSLLIDHGVAGTTLAAIGERAGYSRGLVTHRFGSKAGLLAYLHDTVATEWIELVKTSVGASVGMPALQRVVEAVYAFSVDAPDAMRAMYLLRYASIDPSSEYCANVSRMHRAQQRDVRRWIAGGQADGSVNRQVRASLAAELFCASLDGLIYRWLVSPDIPVERLYRRFWAEVCQTLGVRGPHGRVRLTKPRRIARVHGTP